MTDRQRAVAEWTLVGSVTAFGCLGVWLELHYTARSVPWPPGAYLLTLAGGAALPLRRSRPGPAALACLLCVLGYHLAGYPGLAPAVLLFVAIYALPVYGGPRGLWYGLAVAAAVWTALSLPPHPLPWYALDVSMPALCYAATAVVGESARRRRAEHEARVREEAAAAEERLGRRLAEERLRIARELHDVLAHTISVVAVQSGVALDALDGGDAPAAREAMRVVRGSAKQAMPELRAALDLLRGRAGDAPGTQPRPQPGLGQLPELAAQVRDSGLAVELAVDRGAAEAPALLQLTAYRLVQEALTNALRHARSAERARVRVRALPAALVVEVVDDGAGPDGRPPADAPGFGLLGMRERAEALGGSVQAGPRPHPETGFRVTAELPWERR
ncbi:sensor histidine kinase [Phaeacidiphilus oryzae]|uniref:sensor histidine kinase n=1 Tax=Phaeacidiphilus oryzae TaxID=348818 RepID=UPI00068BBAAD|nr:sensor histidine kinase [Phaeacidiphilus oryzae]